MDDVYQASIVLPIDCGYIHPFSAENRPRFSINPNRLRGIRQYLKGCDVVESREIEAKIKSSTSTKEGQAAQTIINASGHQQTWVQQRNIDWMI
jgi:hypothetical protein